MGIIIRCDQFDNEEFPRNLNTDICSVTGVKWKVTVFVCVVLLAVGVYLLKKHRFRCHKTLLTFHNIRAAVALFLLSINTLELARACLPEATTVPNAFHMPQKEGNGSASNLTYPLLSGGHQETEVLSDHVTIVIGNALMWNALTALSFTVVLMWYHRVVELKKAVEFLYVSSAFEGISFLIRIYELAEVVYERSMGELEPSLQGMTALCYLGLAFIDGFTVYKERYRLDYLEDYEKIGYMHTLATFYSKACFWWLNPLLWFGYKEPLELEDLGQMRVEDSARAHYDRFLLIYTTTKVKNDDRPPSLWLCYVKFCWRMFALGGVLKLFGDLFSLIGPLAIQQIVQYIEIMYGMRLPKNNNDQSNRNTNVDNHTDSIFNALNNKNSVGNNNNSSIMLRGLKDQLRSGLASSSRSLLFYMASSANKNTIGYESGVGAKGISIRATGTNWLAKSPNDDYYYDYGDDDVVAGSDSGTADVDSLSPNASETDVKIYYPSWLDLLSNGWAIAWIVLLAALAQGALSQASTHILNMTGIRIKTSLQGLIYRKTLLLNASCIDVSGLNDSNNINENNANMGSTRSPHERTIDAENKENIGADEAKPGATDNKHQSYPLDKELDGGSRNVGAITNLMSEDTLNIMSFFWIAHYVWAIPLKIAVVMYLLYLKLGISAVIGSFVCILTMTPLQFLIGKAMSNNTETMARFTDERLKRIHETFVGIKLIKLNAWDDVFLRKIGEARAKELKYLNKDSIYWTLMTILTHISTVLITFVTLAMYISLERDASDFTASHLFSALALFQQLTVPLLIFPITVPIIISAVISTKRLERFLYAREIQKQFEGIRNMARILSKSDASLDMYEVKDKCASLPANITATAAADSVIMNPSDVQHQNKLNERIALKINVPGAPAPLAHSEPQTPLSLFESTVGFNFQPSHGESNKSLQSVDIPFKWQEPREKRLSVQRRELLRNTPYVVIRPRKVGHMAHAPLSKKLSDSLTHRESLLLKMPDDMAVSVKQATFAWNPQRMENVLHIKDIAIPKGRLTIIVGKNGSGKTSLLAAMLMEMPLISGDMIWNKTSTIAFVPQQPWLLNASIRENILFGESFRPKRYDFVLEACALKPDIELMPESDQTIIGERGFNISGGQRQRIAIARALYSSANVVIMDDPLSSLDNAVARHIFEQSIKNMLLKSNRTVLLVTQQLQLVQQADYLIVMKDGRLQASGTYKEIEMNYPHIITKWNSIIAKLKEQQREQQNETNLLGRTARERWKLFKNVTRIGLQRSISVSEATTVGSASEIGDGGAPFSRHNETAGNAVTVVEDEDDVLPASSTTRNPLRGSQSLGNFTLTRTRSSIYGSRHLIYDVPLPIDECQTEDVIMRRRRRGHSQRSMNRQCSMHQHGKQRQIEGEQAQRPQYQQRPDSLRTSWNSSRFSGLSNASAELRRSLLTASYSSATSCDSNYSISTVSCLTALEGLSGEHQSNVQQQCQDPRQQRVHSWQPQGSTMHVAVTRNISSPGILLTKQNSIKDKSSIANIVSESFEDFDVESNADQLSSDADLVADLVKSSKAEGGFQQFLRRMSMRRSYKPTVGSAHRIHRPVSATNSILSISEETSTTPTSPTTPMTSTGAADSIIEADVLTAEKELDNELQTESHSDDSCIGNNQPELELDVIDATTGDYKILANKAKTIGVIDMSEAFATAKELLPEVDSTKIKNVYGDADPKVAIQTISTTMSEAATVSPSSPSSPTTSMTTEKATPSLQPHTAFVRQSVDVERKYGKISAKIYLLYLRASGLPIVLVFFISALIWQCLRVYTDVWLQHWTDDSSMHNGKTYNVASLNGTTLSKMTESQHEVTYYFRVYAMISCVCILMAMISTPAGQLAGCNARRRLHDKLLETIMRKSLHFFQITPLGRIMNRFTYDMAIIDKKIAATSQRLLQFTLLCLCAVLINVSITPWFILLTLPICGAYYAIQKFYRCSSRELQRIENATNSPVISHLSETIEGVTTIRAYNQEARFTEILFKRLEANTIAFTILNTSNRWLGISLDYLGGVIVFVAIVTALVVAKINAFHYESINSNDGSKIKFPSTTSTSTSTSPSLSPSPSPSLVGLAINYTLLVPIYLNWVVKLLADMEMYVGSVERIAYYAEPKMMMMRDGTSEISKSGKQHETYDHIDEHKQNHNTDTHADNDDDDDNDDEAIAVANVRLRWNATTNKNEEVHKVNTDDAAVAHDELSYVPGVKVNVADATKVPTVIQNFADASESISGVQQENSCGGNTDGIMTTALTVIERNEAERRASIQRLSTAGKRYKTVPISWPQRGDISFENVSLRYEGQTENVIKNLTLKIPAGQKIGICGRTGSGKSSLALSLFGVLQTTSGRICIDDVDIAQIHPDEIRTRLSIIPQDVHLFSATIRENLDPPGYYSDLALWNCLEMAQLKDFVNGQLSQGLDTEITDGGQNLSAGHRQLFCLARAILRGSVCLVLDEATSSLDCSTERALLDAAHKAFQGRTIITIAHRLSTILDYDRIIVLEHGKIVEDGKPQELQSKPDGVFNALLHSGRPLSVTLSESGMVM